jgi:hypothetical protein
VTAPIMRRLHIPQTLQRLLTTEAWARWAALKPGFGMNKSANRVDGTERFPEGGMCLTRRYTFSLLQLGNSPSWMNLPGQDRTTRASDVWLRGSLRAKNSSCNLEAEVRFDQQEVGILETGDATLRWKEENNKRQDDPGLQLQGLQPLLPACS